MTASIQQIQNGITRYMTEEMAKKTTGPTKFAVHFLTALISPNITSYIMSLQNTPLLATTLFDDNGNVNITAAADAARDAMRKSNGKIAAFGFVFDESDIDSLINYIIA